MTDFKSHSPQFGLAAAILFPVAALVSLLFRVGFYTYGFGFISVLDLLAAIFYAVVVLYLKRRDILLTAAVGSLCFVSLLRLMLSVTFASLLQFFGGLALFAVFAAFTLPQFEKYAEQAKKFWYLPAAGVAAALILGRLFFIVRYGVWYGLLTSVLSGILADILQIAAYLFASCWIVFSDVESGVGGMNAAGYGADATGAGAPGYDAGAGTPGAHTTGQSRVYEESDGFCDMTKHVLLLLFTFGIWYCIWIYRTTGYLNRVKDEPERNPTTKLLLCMFVPFYLIYWVYKSAQRVDKLAVSKGVASDITTLCVVLAIFIGFVPPILMQDKLNAVAQRGGSAPRTSGAGTSYASAPSAPIGTAGELKAYKDLLDSGVITQEEFDEKKRRLLEM